MSTQKKVVRRVMTTASGKKVIQVRGKDGRLKTFVVKKKEETKKAEIEDGLIVQRKIVVGPDGKKRLVVKRTAPKRKKVEEVTDTKDGKKKGKTVAPMEVLKSGWLKKQGGRQRLWAKMFCVLRGHVLLFYRQNTDREPTQKANLSGLRVIKISEKIGGLKFVFQIFHPTKMDARYKLFLQAANDTEYEEWFQACQRAMGIAQAISKPKERDRAAADRLAALRERLANQEGMASLIDPKRDLDKEMNKIVPVIDLVCEFIINKGGLTTRQLLSKDPAVKGQAKKLMARHINAENEGKIIDLDPENDGVQEVLAFLELYVLSIDYPILTYGQYEELLTSYHKHLALGRVTRYSKLLDILPNSNKEIAKRLLELFCYIVFNTEKNNSKIEEIVQRFGKAFLRAPNEEKADHSTERKCLAFLIKRAYLLFPMIDMDEFDQFADDADRVRFALRQICRFSTETQLPGTGVGEINVDQIGTGKTIEKVDVYSTEVTEITDKFSRDVGTQGYLLLITRQIESIQAQVERLASADQEIKKWEELDDEMVELKEDIEQISGRRDEFNVNVKKQLGVK